MPRWRRDAEALIAHELGGAAPTWVEWGALPVESPASPFVLSAVGYAIDPDVRSQAFESLARVLPSGGTLVVVDHNRPRSAAAAIAAVVGAPRVPGTSLAARWRRLADPTARAVQAAGFRVERLRLAADERVQIVIATCTRVGAG